MRPPQPRCLTLELSQIDAGKESADSSGAGAGCAAGKPLAGCGGAMRVHGAGIVNDEGIGNTFEYQRGSDFTVPVALRYGACSSPRCAAIGRAGYDGNSPGKAG